MENYDIYNEIKDRCGRNIYIGVVGPVRTGKSTFIKSFMDRLILPNIKDPDEKQRTKDELPQSGDGKTIMTTEPKFIPGEAVKVNLDENTEFSVRMIDCVGYMAEGAAGHLEGDSPRMVATPWSDEKIPFEQAAEIGTKKVIEDHSSIGILVTTDGTVTDLDRSAYVPPEKRAASELSALNKPFVIILNTKNPSSAEAVSLARAMEKDYSVPVIPVNCQNLKGSEIELILKSVLYEFPISEISFDFPGWIDPLPLENSLKSGFAETILNTYKDAKRLKDIEKMTPDLSSNENIKSWRIEKLSLCDGKAEILINLKDNLFYSVLSETTGTEITSDRELISTIKELTQAKEQFDKIKNALTESDARGYGTVSPLITETELEEPVMFKQGLGCGIRLKAKANAFHIIKAPIETEVSPVVGTETQTKDLLTYLKEQYSQDPQSILSCQIFGKPLSDLITEGQSSKLSGIPDETRQKLCQTITKIQNKGSARLICILL